MKLVPKKKIPAFRMPARLAWALGGALWLMAQGIGAETPAAPTLPGPDAAAQSAAPTNLVVTNAAQGAVTNTGAAPVATATSAADPAAALERLKAKLAAAEAGTDQEKAQKKKLADTYRSAIESLQTALRLRGEAARFRQLLETGPAEAARIRQALQAAATNPPPAAVTPTNAPLSQLEQELLRRQAEQESLKARLAALDKDLQSLQARPDQARSQMAEARKKLAELEQLAAQPAPPQETPEEADARKAFLEARRQAIQAELDMLDQDIRSLEVRRDLLQAQREELLRAVTASDAALQALQTLVNRRRVEEAERLRRESERQRREAIGQHPVIVRAADTNSFFSSRLTALAQELATRGAIRDRLEKEAELLQRDFANVRKQIELGGLSAGLAQVLRDQSERLPDPIRLRREMAALERRISQLLLERFQVEDQLSHLEEPAEEARRLLAEAGTDPNEPEAVQEERRQALEALLRTRRDLLTRLSAAYGQLLTALYAELASRVDYEQAVAEFRQWLEGRLLWIPSGRPVGSETFRHLGRAAQETLSDRPWREILRALGAGLRTQGWLVALGVLLAAVLQRNRRALIARLENRLPLVRRISTDAYGHTLAGLGITVLLAAPAPLLLAPLGFALMEGDEARGFGLALGRALWFAGWHLGMVQFLIELCRPKGVAEGHFRWHARTIEVCRRRLPGFRTPFAVLIALTGFCQSLPGEHWRAGPGLVVFVAGMGWLGWRLRQFLDARRGLLARTVEERPAGWAARLGWLWVGASVLGPAALAGLALVGYQYTALELTLRLLATLWFLAGVTLAYWLGLRWFQVRQRKVALARALERARERREAAQAAGEAEPAGAGEALPEVEERELDLAAIARQSGQLLRALAGFSVLMGLWLIWSDVLPALHFLDEVRLWPTTVTVEGAEVRKYVTLLNLLTAGLVGAVTVAAARNLPGVLEIAVLQNLPLEPSSRYAISTLSQYAVSLLGIIAVFQILGVNWSQLGWIVAAMSVGLGFGLQEIVANFVCGLLLLLERPIRVGDVVTVGDVTGVVSRIQIRATTITNWDRQELVVPNKEFITGRILNWTLSNALNRIVVVVGVAYGSDTEKAKQLLLEIAAAHPEVLDDPPPSVSFEEFQDSALKLTLRCYLPNLDKRLATIHDLHTAIHRRFNEAGIEIAFPQLDLHLRSIAPQLFPAFGAGRPAQGGSPAASDAGQPG